MPVSLASLPAAVRREGERGIREGIRKEVNRLTRPTMTVAAGAAVFFVTYAMQARKQRLERIERKLDRLDDKTDELHETS